MITDVCILGERVSGTCFITKLITSNTNLKLNYRFGHKHFFQDVSKLEKSKTSHILFIFITRDVVEWLQSFMVNTYHSAEPIRSCRDFSTFIRSEWSCIHDETSGVRAPSKLYKQEMMNERDPDTKKRFENVIKMRTSKIVKNLELKDIVENFTHVKYEDVRDNPELFVETMCSMFGIQRYLEFSPVDTIKGRGTGKYVRKIYPGIQEHDLEYIISNIDHDIEKKIGYM